MNKNEDVKNGVIFSSGESNDAFAQYFTGQSYLNLLVNEDDVNVVVGNVTFEPAIQKVIKYYLLQVEKVGTKKKGKKPKNYYLAQ